MAKLPQLKRLLIEDFPDQSDWIGTLIDPLNQYIDEVSSALSRNLTISENMSGDLKTVDVDGIFPIRVAWDLKVRPVSVLVGQVSRVDGQTPVLNRSVGVQWSFNQSGQLQIDNVLGLLPAARFFVDGDVSAATDKILLPLHEFTTGQKITLATSGAVPAGLSVGSYYIIYVDTFHVKFASTLANALAGTAVNITAAAGGGYHTVTPEYSTKYRLLLEVKTG